MTLETAMLSPDRLPDLAPLARAHDDYAIVRRAIAYISERWRAQPEIEEIGLAVGDPGEEKAMLADMGGRWTKASYVEDKSITAPLAARIFDPKLWRPDRPLRIIMIGTDFEVRVWETLLGIPMGKAATYSAIASKIGRPKACRAVGAAVGKNPLSFVVPCHRVLGRSGDITGYHWGLTRKRAMLGWEAGQVRAA